ncbi:MAG TPA: VWA domain-containing protein [Thermomicrobiales bacterium]|mgnify:CR=1 FL=1|nr:VWA domain-containing protein [Thermomicrobiales bacterium]
MTTTRRRFFAALLSIMLLLLGLGGIGPALAQGLDPMSVEATVFPGESTTVNKTIHTPEFPPLPDIMFLSDTTGSMGGAIANVQTNATTIMNTVLAAQPTAQFGAAQYRDEGDTPLFAVDQQITANTTDVQNAINTWAAGGGGDTPEGQINALWQLAQPGTAGFRPDPATSIIVWFGDASGHDPSNGHTMADAIAALQAAEITVLAINVDSGGADGLDNTGQATAITGATGGTFFGSATPDEVSNAILALLSNLPVEVSMQSTCVDPISTTFAPASQTVTSGEDAAFVETISVAAGAAGGDYTCRDVALLNGEVMTDDGGNVIYETKLIHVPGIELTPETAVNELGTPGQTHTVTATVTAGTAGPLAGVPVVFTITTGPNAGASGTCSVNADCTTDANGQVSFTYEAMQGPAGLGTDTIVASFTNADGTVTYGSDTATKDWVDTTPPVTACVQGPNPGGKIPKAPGNGGQGQNQDGFYQLNAEDAVWPAEDIEIFVVDTGTGTVFGPFAVGTNIKYTEANGATPSQEPMSGAVAWHIKGQGDMAIVAVDGSGNASDPLMCLVPPPPK